MPPLRDYQFIKERRSATTTCNQSSNNLPGEKSKMLTHLAGYEIKSMKSIFKTEMLICHSKANLDEKILFGPVI